MEPESKRRKTGGSKKEEPVPSGGVAVAPTPSPPPEGKLGGVAVQESVRVEGLMKAGSSQASVMKEATSPPVEKTSGAQPEPGVARNLKSSKTGSGRKVCQMKGVTHAVGKQSEDQNGWPRYYCRCGNSYHDKSKLNAHIRAMSAGEIFECRLCPKRFDRNENLISHVKHTHKAPYWNQGKIVCSICAEVFGTQNELRRHRASQHPGQ